MNARGPYLKKKNSTILEETFTMLLVPLVSLLKVHPTPSVMYTVPIWTTRVALLHLHPKRMGLFHITAIPVVNKVTK